MENLVWEVQYLSVLPIYRHCRGCRAKREFICSGQFRINAQGKSLGIWLIYKCSCCGATWNAALYSRIPLQALRPGMLEAFHRNDQGLAEQFAMDSAWLQKIGAETGVPPYQVLGPAVSFRKAAALEIKTRYFSHIRVASIVREKLGLSQKEYSRRIEAGSIKSVPEADLRKCRLKNGILLIFPGEADTNVSGVQGQQTP